ncbi:transcriptional regulator, RpiR family [Alkalibacterium subtropicum]|uniref:Transcriptional regulator, RpiR family n=1 Tax=Alkalibacterium subtropicum TaxID=753702 RepID=A0A1I1GKI2_9LACT|nr:MurR/RpiR family transcriptional regulator [Alkalibacterium subtropicum]SFC11772.1 transcriptional regulator, RpiR family [Alkalibacterium subtropicum]
MNQSFQNKNTQMRIRSIYSTLSDKERLMADFILEHPEKIIHGTINEIAEELNLADSTVFRFTKKLSYKGFQDLKISLATESVNAMKDVHEKVSKSDDEKTILEKVFCSNIKTLQDTLEVIDDIAFARAVDTILHANKIELFGFGGSNVIAMDGYHKFIRTGLTVSAQTDSHMQLISASQLTEGDVAVLISHTGHSKDILEILETVKEQQVATICITGFTQSPLSQGSDISLYTLSEETDFRSEALASRIAQLSILDALYVNVMASLDDKGQASLQHVRKAIQKKRL